MEEFTVLDYISLFSLFVCWSISSLYSSYKTSKNSGLFTVMHSLRKHWMRNFVKSGNKEPRITDAQLVHLLQNSVSFYITITIFIIAGLMTMFTATDTMLKVLSHFPYGANNTVATLNIKILLLLVIFIIAFFRLSWSLRQGRYYAVAMFAIPTVEYTKQEIESISKRLATSLSLAGKSFHNAYHAYYFGMSSLSWIVHPILFIITNIWVILVIYRREFNSNTLTVLEEVNEIYKKHNDA